MRTDHGKPAIDAELGRLRIGIANTPGHRRRSDEFSFELPCLRDAGAHDLRHARTSDIAHQHAISTTASSQNCLDERPNDPVGVRRGGLRFQHSALEPRPLDARIADVDEQRRHESD